MRRLAPLLLTLALVASACSYDELFDLWAAGAEGGQGQDLSANPETAPAGASVPAVTSDDKAEEAADTAADTKNPDDVTPAIDERPQDDRYWIQRGIQNHLAGNKEQGTADMERSRGENNKTHSAKSQDEQDRRWVEKVLETSLKLIPTYEEGSEERTKLSRYYCNTLLAYSLRFSSEPEAKVFLLFVPGPEICAQFN